MRLIQCAMAGLLLGAGCVLAQSPAIYTCVDSKGRRLTSDRPIIDCIDREQKELNPSGTLRRRVGPSLTAKEEAAEEEKARKAMLEQHRAAEEKRRDRALLTRYPNRLAHDKERSIALDLVDDVIEAADKRPMELIAQRRALANEAEFFKKDPSKMPERLKREIAENEEQQAGQKRFLAEKASEKVRINARFDEELERLRQLWALQAAPPTAALPAPPKK